MANEELDFYSRTALKSYNLEEKVRYQLSMLDSLDAYTRKHCENVANITCRLCEYLKMDEGFTIYCTTCAYLHDIGKIFIPPSVLQKPSKLTEEEYEIMKTHTTIGYRMCMKDPKLRPYAAGTLYHHEALNGTGYPNGLKEKDIPIEAQIIRVADEYEAITAKRQYKTHIGIIETLNILIDNTKPTDRTSKIGTVEGMKIIAKEGHVGKINKRIVKALFRVVLDDIEYEISARTNYVEYLKGEVKRAKLALKYYEKMEKAKNAKTKEYYRGGVQACLRLNEKVEAVPEMYSQFTESLKAREAHIKKLYDEVKQIKKLVV